MAKGKHSAALFEVISKSKGLKQSGDSKVLETPRWWFKRRDAIRAEVPSSAPAAKASASFASATSTTSPSGSSSSQSSGTPVAAALPTSTASSHESHASSALITPPPAAPTEPMLGARSFDNAVVPPLDATYDAPPSDDPRSRPVRMSIDGIRKQISVRMTYTSAAISLFALAVIVGIAYLIGQHMNRGPNLVLGGPRTADLRAGPKYPSVLDVRRPTPGGPADTTEPLPAESTNVVPAAVHPAFNEPHAPATSVVEDSKRVIGMNYIIAQTYPDKKGADDACDALNKHGIHCTVEKALKDWNSWYAVVTIRGFDKIRNSQEYDRLKQQITEVSAQFAGKSTFKGFEPMPYKWRENR